jgi:twitching motility protein PilU
MRTFDWALFELYNEGLIGYDEAIRNADSANELRLNIKLKSQRGEPTAAAGLSLELHEAPTPEQVEAIRKEELRKQQEKREELELARLQAAKAQAQPGPA